MCDSPGCPAGIECPPYWFQIRPDYEAPKVFPMFDPVEPPTFGDIISTLTTINAIRARKTYCLALLEQLQLERGSWYAAGRYLPNADDAQRERERLDTLARREILRATLDIDRLEGTIGRAA